MPNARMRRAWLVLVLGIAGPIGLSVSPAPPPAAAAAGLPVRFAPHEDHAASGSPVSLAFGDLNHDALVDVVATDSLATGSSVLLGTGGGGFGAATSAAGGDYGVQLADLDGDSHLDIVASNYQAAAVSVALGDGTGSFGAGTDFAVDGPVAIAVADLDGDQRPDVVTGNYSSTVSVLLGTGTGELGERHDYAAGALVRGLALDDLNRDGRLDVVTANQVASTVSVLLGEGGGRLGMATVFPAGPSPTSVALGDIDGDQDPDVVVNNITTNAVAMMRNDGSGRLGAPTTFATGAFPAAVALGDLNDDGIFDVATANTSPSTASVLIGTGAGGFLPATDVATGSGPFGVVIHDVDGDARPDLATANLGGSVSVLRNVGPADPPGAPAIGAVAAGNGRASVSWTAPVTDGGSPVTGYVITPHVGAVALTPIVSSGTGTTRVVDGLSNGTTYRFTVAATNGAGTGAASELSDEVTPLALPTITAGGFLASPEGNTGSRIYDLPVHLSAPSSEPVAVAWQTVDTSADTRVAAAGTDFVAASGTVAFMPGDTEASIPIEVLGDTLDEPALLWGEWGLVRFFDPTNAFLDTTTFFGHGLFIVIDDDVTPTVLPGGASIVEGDAGTTVLAVPVTLSEPSGVPVTVEWTTIFDPAWSDNAARPGIDYEAAAGVVSFAAGETVQTVPVAVNGDVAAEADELVAIAFRNPTNAVVGGFGGVGFGGIVDNDQPPVVRPGTGAVAEGDDGTALLSLPVTLSRAYSGTVTVDWETLFVVGGPSQAEPGVDYVAASGTLTFAPGDTSEVVSLMIIGDTVVEPDEPIVVALSNPVNATLGGSILDRVGFATIADDD